MKSTLSILTCLITWSFSFPVSAEIMGLVTGKSAYVPTQATTSVEVGAGWYTQQLQWTVARVNFKPTPRVITYLDFAVIRATDLELTNSRRADFLGPGYGGGIMFAVPDFLVAHDVAFKASYHTAVVDETGFNASIAGSSSAGFVEQSLQQSSWTASFILSPIDPLYENGTTWYSSLGFASLDARTKAKVSALGANSAAEYNQINKAVVGFGLLRPLSRGRIYAGVEWLFDNELRDNDKFPLYGAGISFAFR